jgi:hypothetical protein
MLLIQVSHCRWFATQPVVVKLNLLLSIGLYLLLLLFHHMPTFFKYTIFYSRVESGDYTGQLQAMMQSNGIAIENAVLVPGAHGMVCFAKKKIPPTYDSLKTSFFTQREYRVPTINRETPLRFISNPVHMHHLAQASINWLLLVDMFGTI